MRSEPAPPTSHRRLRTFSLALSALSAWSCDRASADINIGFSAAAGAGPNGRAEPCAAPWGPIEPLVELNTPDRDCGGHITPDGLAYYFDRGFDSKVGLLVAHRSEPRAPFAAPTPLTELHSDRGESDPTATPDELELFFSDAGNGGNCLFRATRSATAEPWGPPIRLSALCPVRSIAPSISADGLTLYFNTAEAEFGLGTVMVSVRASRSDAFGTPEPVPSFAGREPHLRFGFPSVSPDGLSLFASAGTGQLDIWQATRESTDQPFGAPTAVSELNSAALDGDVSVSADGAQLFLASEREGSVDLYVSHRSCR